MIVPVLVAAQAPQQGLPRGCLAKPSRCQYAKALLAGLSCVLRLQEFHLFYLAQHSHRFKDDDKAKDKDAAKAKAQERVQFVVEHHDLETQLRSPAARTPPQVRHVPCCWFGGLLLCPAMLVDLGGWIQSLIGQACS